MCRAKTRSRKIIGDSPTAAVPITSITLVWEPALCQALGRSRYTIRRWIDQGIIPKPIAITEQSRAWRLRDIEAALDRLSRSRRKPKRRGALMQGDVLVERE